MAARRFLKPSANWAFIAERVPDAQKGEYLAFKSKSDGFFRKVASLPEEPPKIDWSSYKSKLPAALVDSFQKQYESYKVPYPQDTFSSVYDASEKQALEQANKYITEAREDISRKQAKLKELESVPPIETMTLQELAEYYPDVAIDPVNRPTFWPHIPEMQPSEEAEEEWRQKLAGKAHH